MNRTERLFALAEALRARKTGVTAETLAERFAVTVRTIYRDLDTLRLANLPVQAERGRGGGYALDRTYALPPVNFSAKEAALLVAAGTFLQDARFVPFEGTLASAIDKVRGALSQSAQRELLRVAGTLRFLGIPALPSLPAVRRVVEEAWFSDRVLRVIYVSGNNIESERRLKLLHVLMERTQTLLYCRDLDTEEERQFRLDRILRAELIDVAEATDPAPVATGDRRGTRSTSERPRPRRSAATSSSARRGSKRGA